MKSCLFDLGSNLDPWICSWLRYRWTVVTHIREGNLSVTRVNLKWVDQNLILPCLELLGFRGLYIWFLTNWTLLAKLNKILQKKVMRYNHHAKSIKIQ